MLQDTFVLLCGNPLVSVCYSALRAEWQYHGFEALSNYAFQAYTVCFINFIVFLKFAMSHRILPKLSSNISNLSLLNFSTFHVFHPNFIVFFKIVWNSALRGYDVNVCHFQSSYLRPLHTIQALFHQDVACLESVDNLLRFTKCIVALGVAFFCFGGGGVS